MSDCTFARERFDAYFDRELPAIEVENLEEHLQQCETCHRACERLFALNQQMRDALWAAPEPAAGFEARVRQALEREASYFHLPFSIRVRKVSWNELSWAAAAAFLIAAFVGYDQGVLSRRTQDAGLMQDVVRLHAQPLPSDVTPDQPTQVANYFRGRVGFAVHPAEFHERNARLIGARLSNVREYSAAALYYDVNGARVTVVVFQAPNVEEEAEHIRVGDEEILFRDVSGYPVTIRQRDGMVYAFLGDFDRRTMLELAAHAHVGDE